MDHADIEERQIAERYVMGRLSEEEAARFEEHYLGCTECLDRLALAESMERGFKRAATQEAAGETAARQLAVVAWLSRLGRSRQLAALLVVPLALLVAPIVLDLRHRGNRGDLDRQLAELRSDLDRERRRAAEGARQGEETARLRADLDRSELALQEEREKLAQALEPRGVIRLVLFKERDAGPQPEAGPTHQLRLTKAPTIVLAGAVDDEAAYPSYRAVLKGPKGQEIATVDGLLPDGEGLVNVIIPTARLVPEVYTLSLSGIAPGGKSVEVGRFSFRVLAP